MDQQTTPRSPEFCACGHYKDEHTSQRLCSGLIGLAGCSCAGYRTGARSRTEAPDA